MNYFLAVSQSWQSALPLEREAQIFFQQFEREVQQAQEYSIEGQRILFFDESDRITYEKHGDVIRRQLNSEGHVVMCQFVKQVSFSPVNNQLFSIDITLEKDGQLFHTQRWIGLRAVKGE
ncbi:competence protein ComGF [Caldalkalibacillus uzonensis]|uniref:Competence protein ComGF n=1 Tax=Caldalkalibacillus uzonensis TaxID=353224 RepID=A0ABU0CRM8_9BACI|nr:ComGF family competence protein [Caldalkalibacillus uzonensis]MDQ0337682.1 competence protein ComGF [Caldalkalibacillus uzonensis]